MGAGVTGQCSGNRCLPPEGLDPPIRGQGGAAGRANSKKYQVTGPIRGFCALQPILAIKSVSYIGVIFPRQCSGNRCLACWTVWIPHRGRRGGAGRANSKKDLVTDPGGSEVFVPYSSVVSAFTCLATVPGGNNPGSPRRPDPGPGSHIRTGSNPPMRLMMPQPGGDRAPRSAGQVQRRGRPLRVELAEPDHGAVGWEALDLDAALVETLQRGWVGAHLRRRPHADDQPLGELLENVREILEHQGVPVATPPIPNDAPRQHDQVARLLLPFDHDVTEPVVPNLRHGSSSPRLHPPDRPDSLCTLYGATPTTRASIATWKLTRDLARSSRSRR